MKHGNGDADGVRVSVIRHDGARFLQPASVTLAHAPTALRSSFRMDGVEWVLVGRLGDVWLARRCDVTGPL